MDGMADRAAERARLGFPFPEAPAPGAVVEVAEGVLWIRAPLPMALDHVNLYALDDGDGWTLIDTGIATRRGRAALDALMAGPLAGRPVRRVIVTHHHPDHVGLAGWLQSAHGAELCTSRTAWLFARMLTLDEQDAVAPETAAFWRAAGMDPSVFEARLAERPFNYADSVAPMPLGFTRLREGAVLCAGGRDWDVRLGQGHAPDQITLWSRDDGLVIGADQFLATITPNIGVYATEPEADPLSEWLESCARFEGVARDDHLVLPGHKLPFTGLPARLEQYRAGHASALDRLRDHLAVPRVAGACFVPIFGREIDGGAYGLALVEAVAHLNHLRAQGAVRRWRGPDGAWLWQAI